MALSGKVVLVTGASRGLGRAAAELLHHNGARVVAAARTLPDCACAKALSCDVADPAQVAALYRHIDQDFGRVDIVVNNAGSGLFTPFAEHTPEQLERILAVNFKGTFYSCQEAFRRMQRAGGGHILNVISTSGKLGRANEAAYTSAKWAVSGLTECLKIEGQPHNIRATAFCPGGMNTAFWAKPRPSFMPPEVVAGILVGILELPENVLVDDITIRRR
jgi:NAD(P)-dependent dehydrogenase (short-subunit alcohol dehydrogenase family)